VSAEAGTVRRTVLPGGLRVVTEAVPHVRSATYGIWVAVGSRDETPAAAGASHFLEHLLFKGTARRDALEIASVMDAVGGELNAFTAKEYTCFYARVLDDDLPLAVDVVTDMVLDSLLRAEDVEAERGVVLEEIAMHDDDPGDAVHDVFAAAAFGDTPLGRPVVGTVESIEGMAPAAVATYYRRRYRLPAMVVAAAGNLDHHRVVELVRAAVGERLAGPEVPEPVRRGRRPRPRPGAVTVVERPTEQANLVLGTVGIRRTDDRRFALGVLSGALGGGMSSRLFQEIREKRGLAYSVYSFASNYADTGLFGVYAGCAPKRAEEVLALCREQLGAVAARGLTPDELARGKGQLRGPLVLGLEDTGARMTRLGKGELVYGEILPVEEILRRIDAVTLDDVREVARDVLAGPLSLAVLGPFDDHDFSRAVA
jgi:predicted Zn-dependent peptidase